MDPATFAELMKYGVAVAVLITVAWHQAKTIAARDARMDAKVDAMQKRCDDERAALSAEIASVRDAHATDQREVLRAASSALADFARSNGKLLELHERREGSGAHPTPPNPR